MYGWSGVIDSDYMTLPRRQVRGIGRIGGTILGTSRSNPFADGEDGAEIVRRHMDDNDVDGIIAIGGDGTLYTANRLFEAGVPVVGVPKTRSEEHTSELQSRGHLGWRRLRAKKK